jgi:hypothetical protein
VACVHHFGRVHVTLFSRTLGIRKGGARGLNTSTGEVASGASVWPSLRLHVAGASEEGAIPISYLRYLCLEKEESRVLTPNSQVAKCACAKARLWSFGGGQGKGASTLGPIEVSGILLLEEKDKKSRLS